MENMKADVDYGIVDTNYLNLPEGVHNYISIPYMAFN